MMNNGARKSPYSRFLKTLAIIAACFVFTVIIGLTFFWKYLECYEKSAPTAPIKAFVEEIQNENYDSALSLCDENHQFFSDSADLKAYAEANFSSKLKNLRYLKASSEESDGSITYSVYSDKMKIFAVSVIKSNENVGFGLKSYMLKSIEVKYINDITLTAPANAVVYVNGNVLDASSADKTLLNDIFIGVSEDECPSNLTYTISDCVAYPEIAVVLNTNTVLEEQNKNDKFNLVYTTECSEEDKTALTELTLSVGKTYANFIMGDATSANLLSYVYKNSSFCKDIKEYDNSWYGGHSNVKYDNVEYSQVFRYDNTHASINIKMLQTMKRGGKNMSFDLNYTVSYIFADNEWKVVNIISK